MYIISPTYDRKALVGVLAAAAVGCLVRGLFYVTANPVTSYLVAVDRWLPLPVWAGVWFAAGATCLVGCKWIQAARWGLALSVGLWALWAVSYIVSWLFFDQARAWGTAGTFTTLAATQAICLYLIERGEDLEAHGGQH